MIPIAYISSLNGLVFDTSLKSVHENIYNKLKNMKNNGLRHAIRSRLYSIMPETEIQRRLMPKLLVQLDDGVELSVNTKVATHTRPYQVKREFNCDLYKIAM